jgi:hypothetical protein
MLNETVLSDIWVLSGMMKSGFNFTFRDPTDYYKGRIFRYFIKRGIGGDKAFIKQKVLLGNNDQNARSEEHATYKTFRFARAMLGVPELYEFRSGSKTKRRGKVEVKSDEIDRFQSPIQYIVQGNMLYIIPQEIPEKMFNTEFSLNGKAIQTPTNEEFSLQNFLDDFMLDFNSRVDIAAFRSPDIRNTLISDRRLTIQKV